MVTRNRPAEKQEPALSFTFELADGTGSSAVAVARACFALGVNGVNCELRRQRQEAPLE